MSPQRNPEKGVDCRLSGPEFLEPVQRPAGFTDGHACDPADYDPEIKRPAETFYCSNFRRKICHLFLNFQEVVF